MDDKQERIRTDHVVGQLAAAYDTAAGHPDADTRRRARDRFDRWAQVLRGMATGALTIGSRRPVADLPVWATPQVNRGGFATGRAQAGGRLLPHERTLAARLGVPAERGALFAHQLSADGLAELTALLDSGAYRIEVPEEAALPTVAWLLRAGDEAAAVALLDELRPYAYLLRFAPAPDPDPVDDPALVWRETAGEARDRLAARRPNPRVETMREALTVWNPFADDLLTLWLETVVDDRVAERFPEGWADRAKELLARYELLAATHTRCTRHRRPKENLAILRAATEVVAAGGTLTPRRLGLLGHAVASMVRRRGRPGTAGHTALRARQAADGTAPTLHAIARVVVTRLAALPPRRGVRDVAALTGPVTSAEAEHSGVPAGTAVPEPISRVVRRALAGTVPELIDAGVVPSAEVLARLVPRIAAAATAAAYPDETLRTLMAATYLAFRRRRSLLLLDLAHQVTLEELPWIRAVRGHRLVTGETRADSSAALRRLGELALDGFPGTLLPNPLVRELAALAEEAGERLPWVEELAADIFEGTFSAKFPAAARLAGELLDGSLYARYYGIDYAALPPPEDARRVPGLGAATSRTFDALCWERAGSERLWRSVPAHGMVIEQAQILTTHNLATLVHRVGVRPSGDWSQLAYRAWQTVTALTARLPGNRRPLPTVKDIAYAWRQLVFFLSLPGAGEPMDVVDRLWADLDEAPPWVRDALRPAVAGLSRVVSGEEFAPDGTSGRGRRLLGWTVDGHFLLHPALR